MGKSGCWSFLTSSPKVGDGPQLMVLSSAATMMLLFLQVKCKAVTPSPSNAPTSQEKHQEKDLGWSITHPQARLRIFQPHRSCTALGYMVDSREVLVAPQKNKPPASPKNTRSDPCLPP